MNDTPPRPTSIRHLVVCVTAVTAFLLYLDRFCISYMQQYVREDLGISNDQLGYCYSAFFLAYALGQVPSGWLSDRLGARRLLVSYILVWSFFTALMGMVVGFVMLMAVRMGVGFGQAGAYPTSAALVKRWVPFTRRATASSIVAFGGRIGGGLAPIITVTLVVACVPNDIETVRLTGSDVLDFGQFHERFEKPTGDDATDPTAIARWKLAERLLPWFDDQARRTIASGKASAVETQSVVDDLNRLLATRGLFREKEFDEIPIEREARKLLGRRNSLSQTKVVRMNRLLLESVFPDSIRKLYVDGWRPVMFIYGSLGILVAGMFWMVFRERPREHPRCNEAEIALVETGSADGSIQPEEIASSDASTRDRLREPPPMLPILKSRSLWLICVAQWCGNVGWVFLVTWLPRYLREEHQIPLIQRGLMAAIPLWIGWLGMLAGGWACDRVVRKLGLRWRVLPAAGGRFLAMCAYLACLLHPSAWTITALFAVVAFSNDFGNPSSWAYKQDVGGRHVGAIHGWANMWGNLGATVSPILLQFVRKHYSWDAAFLTCATAFFIAGIASLGVDARIPIVEDE